MDVQSWFQRRCCCYDENAVELLDYFIQNRAAKKQQQRLGQRTRDRFFLKVAKSHDAIDTIITTSQLLLAHLQHQHKNTISCIHFEKKIWQHGSFVVIIRLSKDEDERRESRTNRNRAVNQQCNTMATNDLKRRSNGSVDNRASIISDNTFRQLLY